MIYDVTPFHVAHGNPQASAMNMYIQKVRLYSRSLMQ